MRRPPRCHSGEGCQRPETPMELDERTTLRSPPPGLWRQPARRGERRQSGKACRCRARANRQPARASLDRLGSGEARRTGEAGECRPRERVSVREERREGGKDARDRRGPDGTGYGSATPEGVECESEVGNARRCGRAVPRERKHDLERELSAGEPHAGFKEREEEPESKWRLKHWHEGEGRREPLLPPPSTSAPLLDSTFPDRLLFAGFF